MTQPESKSEHVRRLVARRQYKEALKIVSRFRLGLTKEQRITLGRAYESYDYGYLQAQMKRDPEECRAKGIELLKELYGPDAFAASKSAINCNNIRRAG